MLSTALRAGYIFLTLVFFFPVVALQILPGETPDPRSVFIYGGLAWSPDGSMVAVGTSEGVWLHSGEDLSVIGQLNKAPIVTALDWNPNNNYVATAYQPETSGGVVQIDDTSRWRTVDVLYRHERAISSVKWSPNGINLVVAGSDGIVSVWDTVDKHQITQMTINDLGWAYVSWHPSGERIAIKTSRQVGVWDAMTGEEYFSRSFDVETIVAQWSPDGEVIATTNITNEIELRDAANGEIFNILHTTGSGYLGAVAWHPASRRLANQVQGSYANEGKIEIQ